MSQHCKNIKNLILTARDYKSCIPPIQTFPYSFFFERIYIQINFEFGSKNCSTQFLCPPGPYNCYNSAFLGVHSQVSTEVLEGKVAENTLLQEKQASTPVQDTFVHFL